jgi:hypothetical protein
MLGKWQYFRKKMEELSGNFLLQILGTIGSIIRAKLILQNKIKNVSIEELEKLLQIYKENQEIIDFLNYDNNKTKNDLHNIRTTILKPNMHPEKITSLEVLQKQLDDIRNLLKDKKLKEETKLKLEKLFDFIKIQKNIFIENESKNIKKDGGKGFIKEILENIDKYIQKEKNKILQAKKEEDNRINKILLNQNNTELREKRERQTKKKK